MKSEYEFPTGFPVTVVHRKVPVLNTINLLRNNLQQKITYGDIKNEENTALFDGTFIDSRIHMDSKGTLFTTFSVKDVYGVKHVCRKHGIHTVILTDRKSEM